jgi:hypothetical protein
MRKLSFLVLFQAALCILEAYLVSRISLIGKIGIALVHREYLLLRSGWKTFVLFFSIQLLVITVLYFIRKKYSGKTFFVSAGILMGAAVLGFIVTYMDFLHTYTHRLLKERFHLGFYLFWLGWFGSCLFFIWDESRTRPSARWPEDVNAPPSKEESSAF